ncbi:MAG: pyridoxal phosphate-dependent aminotransferase [Anaerovoracaceae bacterium]
MSRFLSERYAEIKAYETEQQYPPKKAVRLDTTENRYPASPFVYRSIDQFEVDNLCMYPDREAAKLTAAIAENYGIKMNQIAIGNGADELLALSFMVFQNPEKKFYFPKLSYDRYSLYAQAFGINKTEIPLRNDLTINYADYCGLDGTVVIANPNVPTGQALTVREIETIVSSNPENLVIIDEAYVDFGAESAVSLIEKYNNLLVIQTFSKSRSLAGARVGFAMGDESIICDLKNIKGMVNRYSINSLSALAAAAAMKDKEYFRKCINDTNRIKLRFIADAEKLGLEIKDTKTNFVLVKYPGMTGKDFHEALKTNNVFVKYFDEPEMKDFVRVLIGVHEQMEAFIGAVKNIMGIEELKE